MAASGYFHDGGNSEAWSENSLRVISSHEPKTQTTLLAMLLCLGIAAQAAAQESAHVSAADYINSGVAKFNKGDMDGAIADYNRAIAIDPGLADAYVNRGAALGAQGDLDAAPDRRKSRHRTRSKSALGYMNRGNARRFKGDLDGALARLQ